MCAAGGADVESKNVVNGVDAFIEAEPRHRIVVSLNRGHCNHRRASLIERANGIVEDGNELTDREPYDNAGRYERQWMVCRGCIGGVGVVAGSQPYRGKR